MTVNSSSRQAVCPQPPSSFLLLANQGRCLVLLSPYRLWSADYQASKFLSVAWEGNESRPRRCVARGCSWSWGTLMKTHVGTVDSEVWAHNTA